MSTRDAGPVPAWRLYRIPEAMALLSMSRSVIYEQIRAGCLRSVCQGRARLISPGAIAEYVELLMREAASGHASRRSRGDGGLHWDERRQRWIASVTVGYTPAGKRITKRGSGRTKTEAKNQLKEIIRDHEDGLASAPHSYTIICRRAHPGSCRYPAQHLLDGL